MDEQRLAFNRRCFLECFSGVSLALMPGALMAVAQDSPRITREMLEAAAKIAGVSFTREEQQAILARLNSSAGPLPGFDALRGAVLEALSRHSSSIRSSLERRFLRSVDRSRGKRSKFRCPRPTKNWLSFPSLT
jgi:hypothetical protein